MRWILGALLLLILWALTLDEVEEPPEWIHRIGTGPLWEGWDQPAKFPRAGIRAKISFDGINLLEEE